MGTLFLELCTERAGEDEILREIPDNKRVGVGVVNQKLDEVELIDDVRRRIARAVDLFGEERGPVDARLRLRYLRRQPCSVGQRRGGEDAGYGAGEELIPGRLTA